MLRNQTFGGSNDLPHIQGRHFYTLTTDQYCGIAPP
ncbi:TPA_asm: hypothetical protein [Porphyromonas phage phage018a_AFR5B1]|uniref:Uncharacterized protein n=1 Tax=Porphyromonas phage phage018a_AFR5B1 TaxID=3154108 RepID=A0AAT9JLJ2_9CAUD